MFRVGDVVRYSGIPQGGRERWPSLAGEKRVRSVGGFVHLEDDGGYGACHPMNLTLVRRPVRAGDRLRRGFDGRAEVVAEVSAGAGVRFVGGDSLSLDAGGCAPGLWSHADGTPIDPPATSAREAETLPPPAVARYPLVNEFTSLELARRAMRVLGELVEEHDHVARALFASDERLLQFVERVADALIADGDVDHERTRRALDRAWERDELGARTKAYELAFAAQAAVHGWCTDHYRWTPGLDIATSSLRTGPTGATHARARGVDSGLALALEQRLQAEAVARDSLRCVHGLLGVCLACVAQTKAQRDAAADVCPHGYDGMGGCPTCDAPRSKL